MFDLAKIYGKRFDPGEQARKQEIWRVLCHDFFQRYIKSTDIVLDLGAGYCEFINNIVCAERIAVDLNPDLPRYAAPGVRTLMVSSDDLHDVETESVDVVFASNFFEHLPDKTVFMQTLHEVHRVLRHRGKLLILQPNIRVLGGSYWDFVDHHIPLTDRTLVEALGLVDMEISEVRPRFLPYTTKSALPQHPVLVRLYLIFRIAHPILGGQAWVVGVKP